MASAVRVVFLLFAQGATGGSNKSIFHFGFAYKFRSTCGHYSDCNNSWAINRIESFPCFRMLITLSGSSPSYEWPRYVGAAVHLILFWWWREIKSLPFECGYLKHCGSNKIFYGMFANHFIIFCDKIKMFRIEVFLKERLIILLNCFAILEVHVNNVVPKTHKYSYQ